MTLKIKRRSNSCLLSATILLIMLFYVWCRCSKGFNFCTAFFWYVYLHVGICLELSTCVTSSLTIRYFERCNDCVGDCIWGEQAGWDRCDHCAKKSGCALSVYHIRGSPSCRQQLQAELGERRSRTIRIALPPPGLLRRQIRKVWRGSFSKTQISWLYIQVREGRVGQHSV